MSTDTTSTAGDAETQAKPKSDKMNFFVLRVASNKEDRVREALVRKESDRKLYPGYVFIELELDKDGRIPDKVWFMIKETEGVGDFIGSNGKPTPMNPKDQSKMVEEAERPDDAPGIKTEYKKGDKIKVTNGAFQNFEGEVDEILQDKGTVRIITTIFGRPTPLELEYWQIEKM